MKIHDGLLNSQPTITVKHPITILPPCTVVSPRRAAGMKSIVTVNEPKAIVSGGPTQTHISPTLAAGKNPIVTVGDPMLIGPPTCGMGGVPGVAIGQTWLSVIRAAGGMFISLII